MTDEEVKVTGGNIELPGTDGGRLGLMDVALPTGTHIQRLWLNRATRRHIERYRHRHPAQWEQR